MPASHPASSPLVLIRLADSLAVCRLAPDAPLADWMGQGAVSSTTRTADELSVVCAADAVPEGIRHEGPFTAFMVEGPLPFTLTGVLARLSAPLAEAAIPIFVLSTFDTDYVLVAAALAPAAVEAWRRDGHIVR